MLFGIRPDEQERLASRGRRMRVYVPYGDEWYGYLMRRMAEKPGNLSFFCESLATRDKAETMERMTVAILGAGVMGETLLSGLVRAGRRSTTCSSAKRPRARARAARAVRRRGGLERRGRRQGRHARLVVKPQDMGDLLDEIAPACRPASCRVARSRHHDGIHRGPLPEGVAGRARHAQHPGARRRGDGGHLAGLALRRAAPRRGRGAWRSTGRVIRVPERSRTR